jgi:hypothetical protein
LAQILFDYAIDFASANGLASFDTNNEKNNVNEARNENVDNV